MIESSFGCSLTNVHPGPQKIMGRVFETLGLDFRVYYIRRAFRKLDIRENSFLL